MYEWLGDIITQTSLHSNAGALHFVELHYLTIWTWVCWLTLHITRSLSSAYSQAEIRLQAGCTHSVCLLLWNSLFSVCCGMEQRWEKVRSGPLSKAKSLDHSGLISSSVNCSSQNQEHWGGTAWVHWRHKQVSWTWVGSVILTGPQQAQCFSCQVPMCGQVPFGLLSSGDWILDGINVPGTVTCASSELTFRKTLQGRPQFPSLFMRLRSSKVTERAETSPGLFSSLCSFHYTIKTSIIKIP